MKTVIPLKSFVTREEVLKNIKDNRGTCYLYLECDWDMANYEHLNFVLDEDVDNGTYLCDVSYNPIKLDNGSLIFEVCATDCADYITQCEEESVY
jgi:hypothetical protein